MGAFDTLVAKLSDKGMPASEAKGIAANAGRKKFGKKRFQKAAALGKPVSKVK